MTTVKDIIVKCRNDEDLEQSIRDLIKNVTKTDRRTYYAPGPAEAWAWLMTQVDIPGAVAGHEHAKPRAVYRGQVDANWGLQPTLLRVDKNERARAAIAAHHFAEITQINLKSIYQADTIIELPPLHPRSGEVAAQHFGMLTPLLDWSALYSVSLDFATRNADGSKAAIWWFNLSDAISLATTLIMPSPFVHRLYLQRGLFTEILNKEQVRALEKIAYKIVFPATHHEPAKAIVDGQFQELSTLETPEPWFENLKGFCNSTQYSKKLKKMTDPTQKAIFFENYLRNLYSPDQLPQAPSDYFVQNFGWYNLQYPQEMLKQMSRLILALSQRTSMTTGEIGLDSEVIKLLQKDNPKILEWGLSYIKLMLESYPPDRNGLLSNPIYRT